MDVDALLSDLKAKQGVYANDKLAAEVADKKAAESKAAVVSAVQAVVSAIQSQYGQ